MSGQNEILDGMILSDLGFAHTRARNCAKRVFGLNFAILGIPLHFRVKNHKKYYEKHQILDKWLNFHPNQTDTRGTSAKCD